MKNVLINHPGDISFTIDINDGPLSQMQEEAFAKTNHGSGQEDPEFLKLGVRSLCVHDTIRIDGKWYQCKPVGWKEVSNEYVEDLEHRVVTHPGFAEHGPWYCLSQIMWEKAKLEQ